MENYSFYFLSGALNRRVKLQKFIFVSGKMIHSMVAHLDAVTSLAIDPNGLYLLSGSKYTYQTHTYF